MPIRRMDYVIQPRPVHRQRREEFNGGIRQGFLKDLAGAQQHLLRAAGLRDNDIALMSQGYVPNGWDVHHKLPIDGGGTNSRDNFILMRRDIHEKLHQDYLDPQVDSLWDRHRANHAVSRMKMRLPWPEGPVHNPASINAPKPAQNNTLSPRTLAAR